MQVVVAVAVAVAAAAIILFLLSIDGVIFICARSPSGRRSRPAGRPAKHRTRNARKNRNLCRSLCAISIDFRCCFDAVTANMTKSSRSPLLPARRDKMSEEANIKINKQNGGRRLNVLSLIPNLRRDFFLIKFRSRRSAALPPRPKAEEISIWLWHCFN